MDTDKKKVTVTQLGVRKGFLPGETRLERMQRDPTYDPSAEMAEYLAMTWDMERLGNAVPVVWDKGKGPTKRPKIKKRKK